jgi:chaperonin cofactor prefoldin
MPTEKTTESKQMEGRVPVPDPTILTTQQLLREIATSREVVEIHVNGVRETIETRIGAMDKAIVLLQTATEKFPHQVEAAVRQLQSLHEEKFRSIAQQFVERDTRAEQTSRDSKVAVDAALQAAKEAVGEQNKSNALAIAKSEATFTKQIDQIGVIIGGMQKGLDDKIDDIKARLQAIESQKKGSNEVWGYLVAAIGIIIAGVSTASLIFSRATHP